MVIDLIPTVAGQPTFVSYDTVWVKMGGHTDFPIMIALYKCSVTCISRWIPAQDEEDTPCHTGPPAALYCCIQMAHPAKHFISATSAQSMHSTRLDSVPISAQASRLVSLE